MAKRTKIDPEKARSLSELRRMLRPGTTVWCVLRSVSRSGMSRTIDFYKMTKDGPVWLSWHIANVLGYRRAKDQGIVIGGCGMDMGFHVVHSLSYALHGMKSKGAEAVEASENGVPFRAKGGQFRAGYSLECRWL